MRLLPALLLGVLALFSGTATAEDLSYKVCLMNCETRLKNCLANNERRCNRLYRACRRTCRGDPAAPEPKPKPDPQPPYPPGQCWCPCPCVAPYGSPQGSVAPYSGPGPVIPGN